MIFTITKNISYIQAFIVSINCFPAIIIGDANDVVLFDGFVSLVDSCGGFFSVIYNFKSVFK